MALPFRRGFDSYRREARGLLITSLMAAAVVLVGFVLVALLRPHLGLVGAFVTALGIVLVGELILWLALSVRGIPRPASYTAAGSRS